jgi:hypothetical protein
MSWLSPEDCLIYAPNIILAEDALLSAIEISQMVAEGVNGADRPFSVTSFTKVVTIPENNRILLPITPLLEDPAPVVKLRGSDLAPRFGRYSSQDWEELDEDNYVIDYDNNEITLLGLNRLFYGHNGVNPGLRVRNITRPPTAPRRTRQAKITYSSGFDFTQNTPETNRLKMALASIVALRTSAQSQGVKSVEISDEAYKVVYASPSDYIGISSQGGGVNGSPINELLSIFKKYKPLDFVA